METVKSATVAMMAVVLWISGAPAGNESTVPFMATAEAAEPSLSESERKRFRTVARWEREMERKKKALLAFGDRQLRDIAWGKERRASESVMIVLDQPLEKNWGPDVVEIEIFERWIDNDGSWRGSMAAKDIVAWWRTDGIEEATKGKAVVLTTLPNAQLGFTPQYQPERERARDWHYGAFWYLEQGRVEESKKIFDGLFDTAMFMGFHSLVEEDRFRGAIEATGVKWEEWIANTAQWGKESKAYADRRWRKLAGQAMAKMPGVFDTIPDPILLIDGKYLLTTNTVQRQGGSGRRVLKRLFQTVNWLVRRQLERMPQHGFDPKRIQWGNERRPRRGEIVELEEPFPKKTDGIQVEWAHSYVTADGEPKPIVWFEEIWEQWRQSLKEAGIDKVHMSRIPLVDDEGQAREHQMVHREATIAWGPELPERRNVIHFAMARRLATDPRGLSSHEAVREMLDGVSGTNRQIYEAVRGSANRVEMLEEAKRKGAAIAKALKRKKEVRDPVLLVNGQYVVAGQSVAETFQILNWTIMQIRKR